jgi:aldehyde:ferredoxin oxidoreductase
VTEGYGKGWRAADYLEQTLDEYYEYHGWDKKTSLPTRRKLEELGLGDVAGVLEGEDALAPS